MTEAETIAGFSDEFLLKRREHFVKYLDPDVLWPTIPDLDMHPLGERIVRRWLGLVEAEIERRGLV